ncbi:MAG: low molecular weight phosphatase family protein [Syntrophobacteraceae bacterium]
MSSGPDIMNSPERVKLPGKVLFLCYGNSCRSIMAEAIARHCRGKELEACSAGLFPLGHVTPHTLEVLSEANIPTDGLYSKGLSDLRLDDVDYMVNLTDFSVRRHIPPSFSGKLVSCYVRDPFGQGLDAFRAVRDDILWLVRDNLPRVLADDLRRR